jgi:hypothetical protein
MAGESCATSEHGSVSMISRYCAGGVIQKNGIAFDPERLRWCGVEIKDPSAELELSNGETA